MLTLFRYFVLILMIAGLFQTSITKVKALTTTTDAETGQQYVTGEIVVKYKDWNNKDTTIFASQKNAQVKKVLVRSKLIVFSVADSQVKNIKATASQADPNIDYAEPNYVVTADATPLDSLYATNQKVLWNGVTRYEALIGANVQDDMRVDHAWDTTKGSTTTKVAVLDTGINQNHQELIGKVASSANFIDPNASATDDNGHGTAVASIIAANTNFTTATTGIAGVCPNCVLLNAKVLGANKTGAISDVIEGLYWAKDMGANVINLSLGFPTFSMQVYDAIEYIRSGNNNITIVAASGNNGFEQKYYPAALPQIIAVGALNDDGTRTYYSNYGPWVDLMAYGQSIKVAQHSTVNGYINMNGTSVAAPFVSGTAALMYSRTDLPTTNRADYVRKTLMQYGRHSSLTIYGDKVLDAQAAVTQPLLTETTYQSPVKFYVYQDNNNSNSIDIGDVCVKNKTLDLAQDNTTTTPRSWTPLTPVAIGGTTSIKMLSQTDVTNCKQTSSSSVSLIIGKVYKLVNSANNNSFSRVSFITPDYTYGATDYIGTTNDLYGDCNGDGAVNAGDLTAVNLEIFDGDGDSWLNTFGGTYNFTRFCDANRDTKVDAGDLSCISNKIFDSTFTCGAL